MECKKVYELNLPLKKDQVIEIQKDAHILGIRQSTDRSTVILFYAAYPDNENVQRRIFMYYDAVPFAPHIASVFLGTCEVIKSPSDSFPYVVSPYVYIN